MKLHRTIKCAKTMALLGIVCLEVQGADLRNEEMFKAWSELKHSDVLEYEKYLKSKNVYAVVPMYQLLRTASDWEECKGEPFAVPPRSSLPSMVKTLELVKLLKERQLFPPGEVVSVFRNKELNKCVGGASKSTHLVATALDVLPSNSDDTKIYMSKLCNFWHKEGKKYEMGLSLYPSGRIHIDTSRYRTWGQDHRSGTSLCLSRDRDA